MPKHSRRFNETKKDLVHLKQYALDEAFDVLCLGFRKTSNNHRFITHVPAYSFGRVSKLASRWVAEGVLCRFGQENGQKRGFACQTCGGNVGHGVCSCRFGRRSA